MTTAIRPLIIGGTTHTPAGTTAYASGDVIANSATALSVVPIKFKLIDGIWAPAYFRKAQVKTPDTGAANLAVRLHLYKIAPTLTNGDNGAWLTTDSTWLGCFTGTLDKHFSDFEKGELIPEQGSEVYCDAATGAIKDEYIYGLLEARGAFTPIGNQDWSVTLRGFPGTL